jgi:hypothetical protein
MSAAWLFLMSSVVGQYPYYPGGAYAPGYGGYYWRTPLNYYDPVRYARYYSGSGYYYYAPPAVANPEVINLRRPAPTPAPATALRPATAPAPASTGTTGVVTAVDEAQKRITLQLPVGTTSVAYGPNTHFLATDGNFPVIKPGNLINVNQNTITILRREQK